MKVLLSYKFHKNITPLGVECEQALQALGHTVFRMDVDRKIPWWQLKGRSQPDRNEVLLKLVKELRPDLLFLLLGYRYAPETLETIKRTYNTRILAWWVENPDNANQLYSTLPWYDYLFSFSKKFATDLTDSTDRVCHFVNYGTDCELYRRTSLNWFEKAKYSSDISFLGKFKERRRDYLQVFSGSDLSIWGPLWKKELPDNHDLRSHLRGDQLFDHKARKLFNATKVNININSWATPSGPNLRVFDVLSCGSFLLTEYVEELEDLFVIGEEIDTFSSPEELKDKGRFYLKNTSAREKIAARGQQRVTTSFKMSDCIGRIFEQCMLI
jgi:spore maturation protein CgeB